MRTTVLWLKVLQSPVGCERCVGCGCPLPPALPGDIFPAFVVEQELMGLTCDGCLTLPAREELRRLRAESAERCRR